MLNSARGGYYKTTFPSSPIYAVKPVTEGKRVCNQPFLKLWQAAERRGDRAP